MALVLARCTQCNAELEVDNLQDAVICKYCGSPFIVEKAINNFNIKVNQQIQHATINAESELEKLLNVVVNLLHCVHIKMNVKSRNFLVCFEL